MVNLIVWLIIGALAGWVAGKLMKGSGFGLVVNAVLGIVGSFVGGWLFSLVGISFGGGFGSFFTAVIGAVVLIAGANFINSRR